MFREKSNSETEINCQKLSDELERTRINGREHIYSKSDEKILRPKCRRKVLKRNNMPSSDINLDHSTNPASAMLSLQLRRAYDERLQKSRKQFNKSRKRVEVLKLYQKIKTGPKLESDADPWIIGGPIDSRDAVLIFRTSVLNSEDDLVLDRHDHNEQGDHTHSSSSVVSNTKEHDINEKIIQNNVSNSKVLMSLPQNQLSSSSTSVASSFKSKFSSSKSITSPKKRLHDSLSSSDNSISSECDEQINDIESNIMKMNTAHESSRKSGYLRGNLAIKSKELLPPTNITADGKNDNNKENNDLSQMPGSILNITYKFHNSETKLLRRIFQRHGLSEAEHDINFNILWTGCHMKADILRNLTPYQRVNHFPRSYELTRKDRLYKNIEKLQHLRGFKHFDIIPQSFILPVEYRDLVSAHHQKRGPWIVKPAASSRGRGIFIVKTPDQISPDESVLVSKYLSNPLCIDGHKCDLRVYVLVTSFDPLLIYIYEEGLVRLATVKYDSNTEHLWNPCMHLTNYSINKYHSDYIKSNDAVHEDVGHKWSLSALLRHLKHQNCDTKQLMSNIEDLIVKSMFACAQSINSACRMFVPNGNNCFELYGFDILIDDTLKPWLLEINLSPSLGIGSPLDIKVKASLMTDLLTLIGIPAFSKKMRVNYDTKWSRFKNNPVSRTSSAEPLNSTNTKKNGTNSTSALTSEEQKIYRNAKSQYNRRGGFVRIFPDADTMHKYSTFLDSTTGIPMSSSQTGSATYSMILPHNYNQMLFKKLYGKEASNRDTNTFSERMKQYERTLDTQTPISFGPKKIREKCIEDCSVIRTKIRKLIESGHEMTQLQSRQAFSLYLNLVLKRLTEEPKPYHEKLILKFLNNVTISNFKSPILFKNPNNYRIDSKDRSAMIANLLSSYLESYNHETEAYIDTFDNYGMIPIALFNEFLSQAQEFDVELILRLHTNSTQLMPYLYNRCNYAKPQTPPIPTGFHGFLKALPLMVPQSLNKDRNRFIDQSFSNSTSTTTTIPIATTSNEIHKRIDISSGIGKGNVKLTRVNCPKKKKLPIKK